MIRKLLTGVACVVSLVGLTCFGIAVVISVARSSDPLLNGLVVGGFTCVFVTMAVVGAATFPKDSA